MGLREVALKALEEAQAEKARTDRIMREEAFDREWVRLTVSFKRCFGEENTAGVIFDPETHAAVADGVTLILAQRAYDQWYPVWVCPECGAKLIPSTYCSKLATLGERLGEIDALAARHECQPEPAPQGAPEAIFGEATLEGGLANRLLNVVRDIVREQLEAIQMEDY